MATFLKGAQEGVQSERKAIKLALVGQREYSRRILVGAVAGEAQVPLFYLAGMPLFEMLTGVRKRTEFDLHPDEYAAFKRGGIQEYIHFVFAEAKRVAPSLLWLDELEVGTVQQNEHVLHPLLREIDDLAKSQQRIALIVTTSQPDALDPAFFLRGRLERRVVMERPHLQHPEAITPSQSSIPAFTVADVKRYYQNHHAALAETISGDPPTVIQASFMTNREAQDQWQDIDFRLPENEIACYVELRGPFNTRRISIPPGQTLSPTCEAGIEVFDAQTGCSLFAGYL
ncbi:MAG: AAA family ATPase [Chloroflexota bacterium]|nr:AAA family ATPase [Chloroflexota bacterium]